MNARRRSRRDDSTLPTPTEGLSWYLQKLRGTIRWRYNGFTLSGILRETCVKHPVVGEMSHPHSHLKGVRLGKHMSWKGYNRSRVWIPIHIGKQDYSDRRYGAQDTFVVTSNNRCEDGRAGCREPAAGG